MKFKERKNEEIAAIFFIHRAALERGYNYAKIVKKCKKNQNIMELRKLIAYTLYYYNTHITVGSYIKRDHSSVIYSVRRVNELMRVDRAYRSYAESELKNLKESYNQIFNQKQKNNEKNESNDNIRPSTC